MENLVLERTALPQTWADWLEAASKPDAPSLVMLRKDNGKFVLQRVEEVRPEIMSIAEKVSVKYAAVLERLADA